jgi:hypothetical protein
VFWQKITPHNSRIFAFLAARSEFAENAKIATAPKIKIWI